MVPAQQLTVRVYHFHEGDALTNFDKHTFLGETTFLLASLMVAKDQRMAPPLSKGKGK
jgi:hypothetical protein